MHWSAGRHSARRRQTAGCDPAATGSGSAQPLSAEISELHLIRNRTLWPLSLSAFLPFHFMSPIPCSDFIYLHGDAIKKRKKEKVTRGAAFHQFFFTAHSLTISCFYCEIVAYHSKSFRKGAVYHLPNDRMELLFLLVTMKSQMLLFSLREQLLLLSRGQNKSAYERLLNTQINMLHRVCLICNHKI